MSEQESHAESNGSGSESAIPPPQRDTSTIAEPLIVGLGASAGGLEALQEFFSNVRAPCALAFVVVQHQAPDYQSMLVDLLRRRTELNVSRIESGTQVEGGNVYVLPPNQDAIIEDGLLQLKPRTTVGGLNLPVDTFLLSLAEDAGARAAAVILSGTGSDGARGVRAIRDQGGIVFAQDPRSAEFDGMPTSAIRSGVVDYVLRPSQLASAVTRTAATWNLRDGESGAEKKLSPPVLDHILRVLERHVGVAFEQYRVGTVRRRVLRRLNLLGLHTVEEYLDRLAENPKELTDLSSDLLVGVTHFFRDKAAWDVIGSRVLRSIFEESPEDETIRVWCVGCSTGEEAYSIAMLLNETAEELKTHDFQLFATDVNSKAIADASVGTYDEAVIQDVPPELRARYFQRVGERFSVRRQLREKITFAVHNILTDPPFTRLDLICCRNLLIYLKPESQLEVTKRLAHSLRPHGRLFLGTSEIPRESIGLFPEDHRNHIFRVERSRLNVDRKVDPGPAPRRKFTPGSLQSNQLQSRQLVRIAAERFAGPGVAVDEEFQPLYYFGDLSPYLLLTAGEAPRTLTKMLSEKLGPIVDTLGRRVLGSGQGQVLMHHDERTGDATRVRIERYVIPETQRMGLFVLFQKSDDQLRDVSVAPSDEFDAAATERIAHLEKDLLVTRQTLHETVLRLESNNEELQSLNEELVASNEELQSTNEELQSVNEELYTVNTEFQDKINELSEINEDLEQLLGVMDMGAVFVNRMGVIRRFNEAAKELFPLIDQDIGRPLEDISLRSKYDGLMRDLEKTLDTGRRSQIELESADGTVWTLRIQPLRRDRREVIGAVMTFETSK